MSWRKALSADLGGATARWDAARWLLLGAAVAAVAIYWSGLDGPFLFDDAANLAALRPWYNGQLDWRQVALGQPGLIESRPVAMLSFLLSAGLGGPGPLSYKLGNVLLHLLCGLLAFRVLRRALDEDAVLASRARAMAATAVALWLLHPIQVSTVLYAVQRMAQLSALFALAAVWTYLVARRRLIRGPSRSAWLLLFAAFPCLLAAGVLSKQNAAVAPLLCLVLELAYFRAPRPNAIKAFFGLFLVVPAAAVLALLAISPDTVLGGYAEWDFSLAQRLLTQARVLCDYLGALLAPRGETMTLFRDDVVVSTGLFSPATTAAAIVALLALSAIAVALRKRVPSVFAGWFFFLAAHSVESGPLPLEMYYEHRNYLPSIGLALAVVGLAALLPARAFNVRGSRLALLGVVAVCALLAWSAQGRVATWRSKAEIVAQALIHHPDSLRARQTQAFIDLSANRYDAAVAQMEYLRRSPLPRRRMLAGIDLVSIACLAGRDPDPAQLRTALADRQPQITLDEVLVADLLAQASAPGRCPRIGEAQAIATVHTLLAAAPTQPERATPKRQLRYVAALLHARAGQWPQAQDQAERAWSPQATPEIGDLLVQACAKNGQTACARRVLAQLDARTRGYDRVGQARLVRLRALIADR
ncbi:hypothetical protein LVB77_18240 [Lysobacter sp. 5GHs7-4]|uniref:hypothetical protein n=1 Tax=Lysobacter sp. 5GHs7-4 TaxID=2904253 RepID=UPI001E4FCC05|nr:hypothetical protein [Lysobacter sp. 5GHs7-4]UHQ22569.1 hypothetical protein LVB77_18240 [Lysobacter sp. 5GHs7-4]